MQKKWAATRLALGKDGPFDPRASTPAASEGRPIGNKTAKAARDTVPSSERLQSSLEKCITNVASNAMLREQKYDARWAVMLEKQDSNIAVQKTAVATKKRKEDYLFLMADTSSMTPEVKE
jgi:hypothetical protein